MKTPELFFAGLGTYLPEKVITVAEAVDNGWCDPATAEAGWISARVAGDMPAPEMAVHASNQALERSGHSSGEIGLIVHGCSHHQGRDGWSHPQYIQRHTVGGHVLAIGLSHSSNGMFVGMEIAANFLAADPDRKAALVCAGDNFGTKLFDRWRAITGAVYGDMGAGLVVSRRSGFARLLTVCSSSRPELEVLNRGLEPIFPPSCTLGKPADFEALMATHDGETLQKAMLEIGPLYGEVWKQALDEAGINASDITRLAHQNTGSEQHLRLMTEILGLEPEQGILRWGQENGRGGACDQIGALDHIISEGELRPGDHVALLSSGPGMVVSCAIIQMTETPAWVAQ